MAYVNEQNSTGLTNVTGNQSVAVEATCSHHSVCIECADPTVKFVTTHSVRGGSTPKSFDDNTLLVDKTAHLALAGSTQLHFEPSNINAAYTVIIHSY